MRRKKMSLTKPTDEKIDMKFVTHPAVHTIDGKLPMSIVNEVNEYVDENRQSMQDYSGNLVGQIKRNKNSDQLKMNLEDEVPRSLSNLFLTVGRSYLQKYSDTIQLSQEEGTQSFLNAPIQCENMWTVNSYDGDYNPYHDHETGYDNKKMSFVITLYLKVPPQIKELSFIDKSLYFNSGTMDGCTQFIWGINTPAQHFELRPRQERVIKPEVGKFIMFPCWLKHQVMPFYGDGERRTLSANFTVPHKTARIIK